MIQVDLTGIHRIMTKYYGSRHMKMDTIVESRHFIRPKELNITFDYDPLCQDEFLFYYTTISLTDSMVSGFPRYPDKNGYE